MSYFTKLAGREIANRGLGTFLVLMRIRLLAPENRVAGRNPSLSGLNEARGRDPPQEREDGDDDGAHAFSPAGENR